MTCNLSFLRLLSHRMRAYTKFNATTYYFFCQLYALLRQTKSTIIIRHRTQKLDLWICSEIFPNKYLKAKSTNMFCIRISFLIRVKIDFLSSHAHI